MRVNFFSQSGAQNSGPSQGLNVTINGPLILAGNPTGPLEAVPKQYVDVAINALNANNIKTGTLAAARLPAFTGDVTSATGSGSFVLSNTGVGANTYTKVTVDNKGRIVGGSNITNDDIPPFSWSKITAGKPTTVAGYGITDVLKTSGATITGTLSLNVDPTSDLHAANKQYVDALNGNGASFSTGGILRRPVNVTPTGFLRANGGALSRTTYSALFEVVRAGYNVDVSLDGTSFLAIGGGQPWVQQYDFNQSPATDITGWTISPNKLPTPTAWARTLVTKNRVYLIGGATPTAQNTVHTAPILSDGTLGVWTAAAPLPVTITSSTLVATKNRVYLIGGGINGGNSGAMYTAPINADGTLGAWALDTNSLPVALLWTHPVVTKNRVYLIGGFIVTAPAEITRTMFSAPINADGTIGTWTTTPNALPEGIRNGVLLATKNRLHLVSGISGASNLSVATVHTAAIASDGTVGTWSVASTFPVGLNNGHGFVTRNSAFVIGGVAGTSSSTPSNVCYRAPVNADGTLGAWVAMSNMPTSVNAGQLIVTDSKVHLIGGITGSSNLDTVYTGNILSGGNDYLSLLNGTINKFDGSNATGSFPLYNNYESENHAVRAGNGEPWRQQYDINTAADQTNVIWEASGVNFPNTKEGCCVFVTKSKVYAVGGYNGVDGDLNQVLDNTIGSNGALGSWVSGFSFPVTGRLFRAIVTKNRVYVMGGIQNNASSNASWTAPIGSDGVIGSWTAGPNLPMVSNQPTLFILKNKLYFLPTYTGSAYSPNVYSVPVNADGTLGTSWTQEKSIPIVSPTAMTAIVTRGRVYLFGTNGEYRIYTITFNSNGDLTSDWTQAGTIPFNMTNLSAYATRNRVYLTGTISLSTALYTAPINADGTLGTMTQVLGPGFNTTNIFATSSYLYGTRAYNGAYGPEVYRASFNGGLNNYASYIEGSLTVVNSTTFNLPDFSSQESVNDFFFVKT